MTQIRNVGSHWTGSRHALALSLLLLSLAGCGGGGDGNNEFQPDQDPARAQTAQGVVKGVPGTATVSFKGIPYAAAPTGELRFRSPQPRPAWNGELDASKPGAACPQASQTTTEDCLYLNVWRPLKANKPLPVFMWVHGGGFVQGSGGAVDGAALASAGVVVVSINYRMGIFGYLAHGAIETNDRDSGNYGVQDAHAALRWVKDNIAAFGGDPNNVTMGGSSAGAMTTCLSSVSPEASRLFNKQIVSSGPCAFTWPSIDQKYGQEAGIPVALGCTGSRGEVAACLRSPNLTVAQLLAVQNAQPQAVLFPSVGGTVAPIQPRLVAGKLPTIMGYAEWELLPGDFSFSGTIGTGPKNPQDLTSYVNALTPIYGNNAPAIAAAYPLAEFSSGNQALNRIEADYGATPKGVYIATCTDVTNFELVGRTLDMPLFAYQSNQPNLHTSQASLWFPSASLSGDALALSQQQIKYWANFMRAGDPNENGLAPWPRYTKATDVIQFTPGAVRTGIDVNLSHKCPFWNSLGLGL